MVPKKLDPEENLIIGLIVRGLGVTFPQGSSLTLPPEDKIKYLINNTINSTTTINNNYYDRSTAENPVFSKTAEGQRFLILQDILALTDSLGTDILETGNHFLEILDRVTKTTDKQETSNDLAEDRVSILTSLATMSALI